MTNAGGRAGQRYRTVTKPGRAASGADRPRSRIGLGSAGREADEGLAGPRHQLGEVDGPADPDHPVGKDPGVVGVPVGLAEAAQGRPAEVVGDAGHPAVPGPLGFRLAQLLGDLSHGQQHDDGADEATRFDHSGSAHDAPYNKESRSAALTAKCVARSSSWPRTPPSQGGNQRFESATGYQTSSEAVADDGPWSPFARRLGNRSVVDDV